MDNSTISATRIETLERTLGEDARPTLTFFALSFASAIIATLGLLEDSAAVIIGAMIIAPLLLPIQGIAFAILNADFRLLLRALLTLLAGIASAIILAALLGLLFRYLDFGSQIMARTHPTILDLGIAISAGAIGGYAKVRKDLAASVAGTAIAVALMPPLCVIGLELSRGAFSLASGAFLLFLTNVLGIILACMAAYILGHCANFHQARKPLFGMIAIVMLLVYPLATNMFELINESRVEGAIREALANTVTFSNAAIVAFKIDWRARHPEVTVIVRASHDITPTQLRLVAAFVKRQTNTDYSLRVGVERITEVQSSTAAASPSTSPASGDGEDTKLLSTL
jgi:uncharacterized hydrophobic protein (TIGR00271 family)